MRIKEIKSVLVSLLAQLFIVLSYPHSYYAIFYASKALLLTIGVKTSFLGVHKKTLEAFEEHFISTGVLDVELLKIYNEMVVRAEGLLQIFRDEKSKRGRFTYETIPQANKYPAEESLSHAKFFVSNIIKTC